MQSRLDANLPTLGRHRARSYSDAHAITTESQSTAKASPNNKRTSTGKKHSRHHHHHGSRPRSKSCDLHRRSPTLHKKKYPTAYKHIPGRHSPPPAHGRRCESGPDSPPGMYQGNMWIRPACARRPAAAFRPAMTHVPSEGHDATDGGASSPPDSPVAPVCRAPSLDDEETTMLCASSSPRSSSFDACDFGLFGGGSPARARVVFGESGKPILTRSAFE
ncbi:hypothetical protein ACHAWF_004377 [Thalassiosira exigua]